MRVRRWQNAYEMGIKPILGFHNTYTITAVAIIFFMLTYFLTVRPSKVVDIIGKFLTPFLILALVVIIVKGIISPLGAPAETAKINSVLGKGLIDGYQTMDCFVSLAVGSVLLLTLKNKGYSEPKQQIKMLFKSGLIACTTLGLIYTEQLSHLSLSVFLFLNHLEKFSALNGGKVFKSTLICGMITLSHENTVC